MRAKTNYYKALSANYSKPGLIEDKLKFSLIQAAEKFIAIKEDFLQETGEYTGEKIEQENKDWQLTHCEALRQGRGDILTAEYHTELVYLCQDSLYCGLEKQKLREKHWWALIAQPDVTMCQPVVIFHGEITYFEWKCVDNETLAKGNVTWIRRRHRGACYLKTEQLTFYLNVFAPEPLLKLITTQI